MTRPATRMPRSLEIARYAFAWDKYHIPLCADAGRIGRWEGFVRDDRAHSLDFRELLLIERGRGMLWLDDRAIRVHAGLLLITEPGQVRRFELEEALDGLILLDASHLSAGAGTEPRPWLLATRGCAPEGALRATEFERVAGLCATVAAEVAAPRPDTAPMLHALLDQLDIHLDRLLGHSRRAPVVSRSLVSRALMGIERHFRSDLPVTAYAQQIAVSADHLSALLRRATGRSLRGLITARRMLEAKRLLLHTGRSADDIGRSIGYRDPSYFARAFRRTVGITPSRFRQQATDRSWSSPSS